MASQASVRVYVGGLPSDVTIQELQERFGRFATQSMHCALTHVDLPKSKGLENSKEPSPTCRGFAYVTLQGADAATQSDALQRTYNRTKWRGNVLKVQVAKPHFEQKLAQERETREMEKRTREMKRRELLVQRATPAQVVEPLKGTVTFRGRKTVTFSDVEMKGETDTEREVDAESPWEDQEVEEEVVEEDDVEAFVKRIEEEAMERKQEKEKKGLSRDEVNARRLAALEAKQKRKKEEKVVIPGIGEAVGNKKILFDDSGNEQELEEQKEEDTAVVLNWMDSSDGETADGDEAGRDVRRIFDFTDADETETAAGDATTEAAFAVRPEFVGEKGKKLFEMQKRFGGDSRFRLDARFVDEEANEYGGNDVDDDEPQLDDKAIAEVQNFLEEEDLQEAARHAREMGHEEEAALRVVSTLFPDVDVTRLQRRMQEQRTPKDPLKEAAWMGELKRYDPRDARACREYEIPMTSGSSGVQEDEKMTIVPKREEKIIPTGGDRFFSTTGNLGNLFSRVRKNSEDGEDGEAALDGVFGIGTATTETGIDGPFKLSSLFSFPVGEDKQLAAMGEQLLEDEQEERELSAGDWAFSQGFHSTDDMVDEAMATDSEAGDEDEAQTKAALTKQRAKKSLEDFLAFGSTFVGGEEVADWPERRKKLALDYKRKRRDAVKTKKQQNKQHKTKLGATATGQQSSSKWNEVRL